MNTTKEKDYMTEEEKEAISTVMYFGGNDYGWEKYEETKKYFLTNPEDIKDFHVIALAINFRGTGHLEWEVLLSWWILQAARKACDEKTECDVSKPFNVTLLARPKCEGEPCRRLTPQMTWNHLSRYFNVVEETEDFCKIAFRVA